MALRTVPLVRVREKRYKYIVTRRPASVGPFLEWEVDTLQPAGASWHSNMDGPETVWLLGMGQKRYDERVPCSQLRVATSGGSLASVSSRAT